MPATRHREFHGPSGIAVVHRVCGAAHAPVCPDVLDGLSLRSPQIVPAAQAHQRCIQRAIIFSVVQEPRFLHFDVRRRLHLSPGVMSLYAIHVCGGIGRVAGIGVEAGEALLKFDVVFKLRAHGRRY